MTITITRTTEFQTTVPDDCDDIAAAVDMARLEANHGYAIIDERIHVAGETAAGEKFTTGTLHEKKIPYLGKVVEALVNGRDYLTANNMTIEEALTTSKCPLCGDGPCFGAVCQ